MTEDDHVVPVKGRGVNVENRGKHVFVKFHRPNATRASSNDVSATDYHVVPVKGISVDVENKGKHQVGVLAINVSSALPRDQTTLQDNKLLLYRDCACN